MNIPHIYMKLNEESLVKVMLKINKITNHKKREWNTIYQGNFCYYWNTQLWSNILNSTNNYGATISRNEFYSMCKPHCSYTEFVRIFEMISGENSREFSSVDLETFMDKISDIDYHNIINCFVDTEENKSESEPEPEPEPEPETDSIVEYSIYVHHMEFDTETKQENNSPLFSALKKWFINIFL